jgi:hypothetical protein
MLFDALRRFTVIPYAIERKPLPPGASVFNAPGGELLGLSRIVWHITTDPFQVFPKGKVFFVCELIRIFRTSFPSEGNLGQQ